MYLVLLALVASLASTALPAEAQPCDLDEGCARAIERAFCDATGLERHPCGPPEEPCDPACRFVP